VAEHGALLLDADWPGLAGVDLIGTDPALPPDVPECGLDAYEAVRIEAGVPVMGREVTDRTIPAELGILERAVSFTKGCFTGQELVARMDARGGQAPRQLRGVVVGTNLIPPVGARLLLDGREVGTLTSVSESLERRAPIALANVSRAVEPPADVVVTWDGGEVPARVETLPLVP
jgi:folate-binding protein YgfZ